MKAIGIEKEEFDQRDNTNTVTYILEDGISKAKIVYDRWGICLVSRELMEELIGLPKKEGE